MKARYPDLDRLWFRLNDTADAKPMIIGHPEDTELRDEVRDYFRIKRTRWPNSDKDRDGFPWMEFDRNLTVNAIFKNSIKDKSIMNVSVAQHCDSVRFSATAWYGANDHRRTWHDGSNDDSADAQLYGYNFEEQWDFAIGFDPDIVFVTGFNEWIAQRLNFDENEPIGFCDNCTEACSHDTEPADALTASDGGAWMTLYLNTTGGTNYDFCINRDAPLSGKTAVMRIREGECETVGYADIRFEGNKLMSSVDKALLGLDASDCKPVMFKWADNCAFADFDSFYLNGDCAPYGRLNYVF